MYRSLSQAAFSCARRLRASVKPPSYSTAGQQAERYDAAGKKVGNIIAGALALVGGGVSVWAFMDPESGNYVTADFTNWSGTHTVTCKRVFEPESEEEVMRLVQKAVQEGWQVRAVGSGISPNALAFSSTCMISMGLLDKVLEINEETMQVRVQAGAKVQDVVEALRPHGLTLQNFASVREQQIGGFTQVSAHGTGARLPPVDEQVVSLRLASPAFGQPVTLRKGEDRAFDWVKVGLGSMGVVTELTLQCVPSHRLLEETSVATRADVAKNHKKWIKSNKHLRYMWIPHTDTVVVVKSNPTDRAAPPKGWFSFLKHDSSDDERLQPMRTLFGALPNSTPGDLESLSMTQLRDALIRIDPLNSDWIKRINAAEAEFWKRSSGKRVDWSDQILGFDCGGQQWVLENCFPSGGTADKPGMKDVDYMHDVLSLLESRNIPAPAPIEQRWTSSSSAPMSPAYSGSSSDVHSWVGIIMYLPTDEEQQRTAITAAFREYAESCERELFAKYDAKWHWAKLEPGEDPVRLDWVREHLRKQYDVRTFNTVRHTMDPENNFGNTWLNAVLPLIRTPA